MVGGVGDFDELEPPPHPIAPTVQTISKRPNIDIQRRRRDGMPSMTRPAKTLLPPSPHRPKRDGCARAVFVAAVVCRVKVAVPFPLATIATLVGFKLQVGRLCAPEGELVNVQANFMVPEYVLPAERVVVAVAVAPGAMEAGVDAAIRTRETVTVVVWFTLLYVASPR